MVRCQHFHIQMPIIWLGWMKSQTIPVWPLFIQWAGLFKGNEINAATHSEEQTLRKQETLCCCILSKSVWDGRVKIPIFTVGVYHTRIWSVGRRRWGNNPHISADIYEPLCMEIAPGQRCKRPLRGVDCGSANLTCDAGVALRVDVSRRAD